MGNIYESGHNKTYAIKNNVYIGVLGTYTASLNVGKENTKSTTINVAEGTLYVTVSGQSKITDSSNDYKYDTSGTIYPGKSLSITANYGDARYTVSLSENNIVTFKSTSTSSASANYTTTIISVTAYGESA